jgi:hypothetical protein
LVKRFRFRPRYRGVALTTIGVGGSLAVVAGALGFLVLPLATGAVGIVLGTGYLLSPAWRLGVTVDDEGFEVGTVAAPRFRLAWSEVTRVVAAPTSHTCFVDGGTPDRSLLVPGDGAPAPYDIEDRAQLFELILKAVPPDKIVTVESLEQIKSQPRPA